MMISFSSQAEIPFFKTLQVDRENKNLRINVLFQDQSGFIWAGTDHGLYTYDGFVFEKVIRDTGAVQMNISCIAEDANGALIVGTEDGIILKKTHERFHLLPYRTKGPVRSIIDMGEYGLWVASYGDGIYTMKGSNWKKISGIADNFIYSLVKHPSGKVFAGTDLGMIVFDLNNGSFSSKLIDSNLGLPDNLVRIIKYYDENSVILGFQEKGIALYNIKQGTFSVPSKAQNWTYGPVDCMAMLQNEYWIGTEGIGIVDFEFNGDRRLRNFNRANGFAYTKIYDLLKDREGNIWVSADNKLLISPGEKVEIIHENDKFSFDSIQAITSDADGYIWFSTKSGLFRYNYTAPENQNLKKFEVLKKKNLHIVSLFEDDWGFLWIGTFDDGLFRLNTLNGEVMSFGAKNGLANANVISISGHDNKLWLATLGGIISCDIIEDQKIPGKLYYNFSRPDDFSDPGEVFVYNVFIDRKNRVWFGTDGKGISVFENGKFKSFTDFDNGRGKVVYSITEDKSGNIWFSTLSHGIYRFDGRNFKNIGIKEGLRELEISGITSDNSGNIVVVHSRGIDVINPRNFEMEYIGAEAGLENIDCDLNSLTTDRKGNIWIGSQKGLIRFYNYKKGVSKYPLTNIRKIYTFMKPGKGIRDSVFKYNQNQISIEFIGLWFNNPEAVVYRYRLFGYSDQWLITHDRIVTFPNLPPGNYRFELEASNNNRFVNPYTASYSFKIKKPLWKEGWFIFLAVLLFAGIIVVIVRDRTRRWRHFESIEKEKMEYQYETLKSQINPHFLFNSFNTLITIIDDDKEKAIDYVETLSDYFRSMLQYRDMDTITLKEELIIVNSYFYLQQKRYGKYVDLQIDIPDSWLYQYRVPPLSIQLLIENCIKHNAVSHETPLYINVIASERETLLINNNLNPKKQSDPSTGIGLENIINRFKILSNQEVYISKNDEIFTVEIPLIPA
jgi:ligand-binding sensor domain-containing protein